MATSTSQEMRDEMARNSAAWHTATTQAEKDALHQRNQELAAQLDAYNNTKTTFDSTTGRYTTVSAGSGSSSGGTASANRTSSSGSSGSSGSSRTSVDNVNVYTDQQQSIKDQMAANSQAWHTADAATKKALEEENRYLSGLLGGSLSFDTTTGMWSGSAAQPQNQQSQQVPTADTSYLQSLLDQWRENAVTQSNNQIDYTVQQAVAELERALADAQPQFKEQAESVAKDEMQGLDNSALYAELRGDKGGIGQSQYNEIQAAAAQNRLAVQQAQTKLSTDTARQIEDLRAQGEFEKADAALEVAQTYLSQLISLEQWAAEYNLSAAQFQASLDQWQAEFDLAMQQYQSDLELSKAQLTGTFSDGTTTLAAQQAVTDRLASLGLELLAAGVMPTDEQLEAMGMTSAQANQYIQTVRLQAASAQSGGGSSSGGGKKQESTSVASLYEAMYQSGDPYTYLILEGYTSTEAENIMDSDGWKAYQEEKAQNQEGMNPDHYQAFAKSVQAQMRTGTDTAVNAAIGNIDSRWNELSEEQKKGIQNILAQYGYSYEP